MGFASYFERISEIRSELLQLEQRLAAPSDVRAHVSQSDMSRHLAGLSNSCRKLIERMDELLQMATDPEVVTAQELFLVKCRNEELETKILRLERQVAEQSEKITEIINSKNKNADDWLDKLAAARVKNDQLQKLNRELRADQQLRDKLLTDPAKVYGSGTKPLKKR